MKVVLQRVKSASVHHEGKLISSIGYGYALLVGFERDEPFENLQWMVEKILKIQLFDDWKNNIISKNFEILVLSQFTLFAKFKGKRPDFHYAESHEKAKELFNELIKLFKIKYSDEKIKSGLFGKQLLISLENDGPNTILLEK
ncbi:D-aminoacyl-tRNA deacylase [Astathelohania contejeani]|uniref:D-aminoacyl-tRNA deacylase n=1 Tax=Astathelohania contejeani TaxID=164912 RepID=A0ABQ7I1C7_9MICR|nr:D-aminoacyl-tRNA deacylase [Thelohania contejeani]